MLDLPTVLPADPRAPEGVRHQPQPLRYGLLGRYLQARTVARERTELGGMSDALLKDVGLSRIDAQREARRGFWDLRGISREFRDHVGLAPTHPEVTS